MLIGIIEVGCIMVEAVIQITKRKYLSYLRLNVKQRCMSRKTLYIQQKTKHQEMLGSCEKCKYSSSTGYNVL